MREDGFVITLEIEMGPTLALDLLSQTIKGHSADEVSRELAGRLLGADYFAEGLTLGLEGAVNEQFHRLGVGHAAGVHLIIENRVDHGPEIELQLLKPQPEIGPAEPLVEHHLFGVDGPPLRKCTRREYAPDQ